MLFETILKTLNCAKLRSLNPYSNGRYSMSAQRDALKDAKVPVLILILLEDTL